MREMLAFAVFAAMGSALNGGVAEAQTSPSPGPRIEIILSDELVLPPDEIRPVRRDSTGNLLSRPGDVIQYTLTAVNRGTQAAHNVEIVDPIPRGTEYVLDSASGEGMTISYSIDGGHTYHLPPVLYDFRHPNGEIEKRPVPAGLYTHVKWLVTQPILPEESAPATLQVRVSAGTIPEGRE